MKKNKIYLVCGFSFDTRKHDMKVYETTDKKEAEEHAKYLNDIMEKVGFFKQVYKVIAKEKDNE